MNSITTIIIIVALLVCLVCYALISQALEQRRQHRQRLLAALQLKASNFKYMLNSIPDGFLTRDLMLLVQRGLIDTCEQLVRLEPKNPAPKQDLQAVTQQMNETRRSAPQSPNYNLTLESTKQVQETKHCLEELHKVIQQQHARGSLDAAAADVYRLQIRQLVLSLTIDSYTLQGYQAREREKLRLAQHYFEIALKLLVREDRNNVFAYKRERLQKWLRELEVIASEKGEPIQQVHQEHDDQDEIERAWEKFSEAESWKKKTVYD